MGLPGETFLLVLLVCECQVGRVGDEVDALADLWIGLANRLAHHVRFRGDCLAAAFLENFGNLGEDSATHRPTCLRPLCLSGLRVGDDRIDVLDGLDQGWRVGNVGIKVRLQPATIHRHGEVRIRHIVERAVNGEAVGGLGAVLVASRQRGDGAAFGDRGAEALRLLVPLRAAGLQIEQCTQEVLRRGVLVESSREVGDGCIAFGLLDDR